MKKTEFISFRCSEKVKNLIEADSIEREWTISHTVEKILTEYYERKDRRSKADCTKYTFLYSYQHRDAWAHMFAQASLNKCA